MFLAMAFTMMVAVASDIRADQKQPIPQEEIELLEQLEFLEALDILKSTEMDQEMEDQKSD